MVSVVTGLAWLWVIAFAVLVGLAIDNWGVFYPAVSSLLLFIILLMTCGMGPCYWAHTDVPWALLIGAFIALLVESRN